MQLNLNFYCVVLLNSLILVGQKAWAWNKYEEGGNLCGEWSGFGRIPWDATLSTGNYSIPATILSSRLVLLHAKPLFGVKPYNPNLLENSQSFYVTARQTAIVPTNNPSKFSSTRYYSLNFQKVNVSHIQIYNGYNRTLEYGIYPESADVAVAHLQTELQFDASVHPVCIPTLKNQDRLLGGSSLNFTSTKGKSSTLFVSGWIWSPSIESKHLRLKVATIDSCRQSWYNGTAGTPYVNKFCATVAEKENTNRNCIHRDNGVFGKWGNRYFLVGLVNRLHSDRGQCSFRARYFISNITESIRNFLAANLRCAQCQMFTCQSEDYECIGVDNRCNGFADCLDGSDEPKWCP